ncbi:MULTISPECIES: class I SAM-dependent methyltransferase [unclassified Caballeronia]|uniref:class I SAM-dependent methyltransferase n=1 Tax=unclassified Caballeronia TaxID=2646786 RepID=UPI0032EE7D18
MLIRNLRANRSEVHNRAHSYWKECSNTFLAGDPTYYKRQEKALRELMAAIEPAMKNGLDIGCGNGHFSLVMGDYLNEVVAFDLSQKLINEATEKTRTANVTNVVFHCRDLEREFPKGAFGVVSCMGVMSTLMDESAFRSLLRHLTRATQNSGFLITKDSLCSEGTDRSITTGPYVTIYRETGRYEAAITRRGFRLLDKKLLAESEGLVNNIYLWSKQ